MKLIIGLGNPGDKYFDSRHNLGFMTLDSYAKNIPGENIWQSDKRFQSAMLKIADNLLAKPQSYMNNSGLAVKKMVDYFRLPISEIIIIHDDLDIPLGKIKIRQGGAAGGHHGVESIIENLGSDGFIRIRLGIGTEKSLAGEHKKISFNAENFVLEPFISSEQHQVKQMIKKAINALDIILEKGLEKAQNQYNS